MPAGISVGEERRRESQVNVITVPSWGELPWLVHGFSTRVGGTSTVYCETGDLNLGFTPDDDRAAVLRNRELLLEHLTGGEQGGGSLARVRQTHSNLTHRVSGPTTSDLLEGDGLISDTPGLLLSIFTADCVPVLVVDRRRRAVGAFHAGWRGTVGRIVESGVQKMCEEFGCEPADLSAAVGPAIGGCCYTVGEEVRQRFSVQFAYADALFSGESSEAALGGGATSGRLDLVEANRCQLLAAGLANGAITMTGACTSCHTDRFFSHRAEGGVTGRMMAVIGIKPETR